MEQPNSIFKLKLFNLAAVVGLLLHTPLVLAAAPPNDALANATVIPTSSFPLSFTDTLNTAEATRVDEPPVSCGSQVGKTVWYSLTAAVDMAVSATVNTFGSNFDTVLAAYTGDSLTQITCNDDYDGWQSQISISIPAGEEVFFMIGGYGGDSGDLVFTVEAEEVILPVNDDFDNATEIPVDVFPFQFTESFNTSMTTRADDDPDGCIWTGGTVWYSFTSPIDAVVKATVNTFGSDFDTMLAAYTGPRGDLNTIACNDDTASLQSEISIEVHAGEQIHFMVGGYSGASGDLVFKLTATDNPRITADCDIFRSVFRMDSLDDLRSCKDSLTDWQEIESQCYNYRLRYHAAVWVADQLCPNATTGDLLASDLIFTWDGIDYSAAQAMSIAETDVASDSDDVVTGFSASPERVSILDKCLEKYDDAEICAQKIAP